CFVGIPRAMSWRTASATISYDETTLGWPPQLTLMPTTSLGAKKRRHASGTVAVPVSAHRPRAIISRTTLSFAALLVVSTDFSDFTETTWPGDGPGMPGTAAGAYALTTFSLGSASGNAGASGAAASNRTKDRRSMAASLIPLRHYFLPRRQVKMGPARTGGEK